jgi:hypothetical protein
MSSGINWAERYLSTAGFIGENVDHSVTAREVTCRNLVVTNSAVLPPVLGQNVRLEPGATPTIDPSTDHVVICTNGFGVDATFLDGTFEGQELVLVSSGSRSSLTALSAADTPVIGSGQSRVFYWVSGAWY